MAYLWGSVKDEGYETSSRMEEDLREIIGHAVLTASGDVLKKFPRCKECLRVGGHFYYLL
jgi:hypothetical protein